MNELYLDDGGNTRVLGDHECELADYLNGVINNLIDRLVLAAETIEAVKKERDANARYAVALHRTLEGVLRITNAPIFVVNPT